MLSLINNFKLITKINLFIYDNDINLPYENKTNDRIIKDVKRFQSEYNLSQESYSNFIIQAIYPQCYILVWPKIVVNNKEYFIISEVFFIKENNNSQVICCEKCNRIINTEKFILSTHKHLRLLGEQLLLMTIYTSKNIHYSYDTRPINKTDSCYKVYEELNTDTNNQNNIYTSLDLLIKNTAISLSKGDDIKAKKEYFKICNILKSQVSNIDNTKNLYINFTYTLTSLTYEIIKYMPSLNKTLFELHKSMILDFLKKTHYCSQMVFIQEAIDIIIKNIPNTKVSEKTSFITQRVLKKIHENYFKQLRLHMIAKEFNIQTSYLSRQFKLDLGIDFSNYLLDYRLNRAILLLNETSLSITDVAAMVGFENNSYFSTKFKDKYKISPSNYKKKCIS